MIDYGYTAASFLAVAVAVTVDMFVLRTRILRTKAFWASYGIVVFFQLVVNGVLTGLGVVQYDARVILGVRLAYAPVEDLGFGFALVTLTITMWVWLERRALPKRRRSTDATVSSETDRATSK